MHLVVAKPRKSSDDYETNRLQIVLFSSSSSSSLYRFKSRDEAFSFAYERVYYVGMEWSLIELMGGLLPEGILQHHSSLDALHSRYIGSIKRE